MAGQPDDVIEAGPPRGPRRWIAIAVLSALVITPVAGLLAGRSPGPSPEPPLPSIEPGRRSVPVVTERHAGVLYPRPRHRGGREVLDVVFPDGSKAEIDYPAELGLAALGVRPALGAGLKGRSGPLRRLTVPRDGLAEVAGGRPMIRKLAGRATLWPPMTPAEGEVLLFDFAPWQVTLRDLKDGMTYEQRVLWAENLRGRVTPGGYLVLKAGAPLRPAKPGEVFRGEPVGPQLWFGGEPGTSLVLAPMPGCDVRKIDMPEIDRAAPFSAETCEGGMYVAASGERGRVREMVATVRVRARP
ncbi:hypothetical protein GCM10017673_52800 [Streptosporangium violaceochromogenes]|nr:hypothetical protein GCM10017673_52800 [Streptosporangium violaceochromogenes]